MKKVIAVLLSLVFVVLYSTLGGVLLSNVQAVPRAEAATLTITSFSVGPRTNTYEDPAQGIYVSPNGNDATANGSITAPYKSINSALAAARPGNTIILRGGTYREGVNVRIRVPNITIKSAKGEWAIIDLTTYNAGHNEDSGVYFDVDSSGGKLQGVEVVGGYYAVCLETRWDWGDPSNRAGASNIIIEDCILHDSRNDVVKVKPNCNNVTIRYNEIYNSGRAYVTYSDFTSGERNAEGIDNVNGDKMLVQNNYIHDICSNAVYAKGGATDVIIENNRIERAYGAGIMVGFDTSPEFFDLTVNSKYYENIRGIVRNNLIINTGWEGIGLYGSRDAQVYNNTIINAVGYGTGLYHSPIYFGLTYQDWEPYAGRPASVNPNIHHNIVSQPASYNRPVIDIRYANELGGMSALSGNPTMSNNCYYVAGKSATFSDRRPDSTLENAGLSAWKTHISGDSGSLEVNPSLNAEYVATNPQCVGMGISSSLTSEQPGGTTPGGTTPGGTTPGGTNPGGTTPGGNNPSATNPGTNPGTTNPGTSNPSTTNPGTTNPGTTNPGTTDPGATNPGATNPGTTDPGTTDPGTTTPGLTDPGSTLPDTGISSENTSSDSFTSSTSTELTSDNNGANDGGVNWWYVPSGVIMVFAAGYGITRLIRSRKKIQSAKAAEAPQVEEERKG